MNTYHKRNNPLTKFGLLVLLLSFCVYSPHAIAQSTEPVQLDFKLNPKLKKFFKTINLDYPGLEKVKAKVSNGKYKSATKALLKYFRNRKGVKLPKYNRNDLKKYRGKRLSNKVQMRADSALEHIFYVHEGYGWHGNGFLHYGKNINWQYWPVHDNEIRWQVNRMKWWIPMGLMYWSTGNEKYAKEWIAEYKDWILKNPLGKSKIIDRFSWRSLEVSRRLQDQPAMFNMFLYSPHFTPKFLIEFLSNYYRHAEHLIENFSSRGNHLLFETQRLLYAACFFPEFKRASNWLDKGVNILTKQMNVQVYPDGLQYELTPSYDVASINIFLRALRITKINGKENEFPISFRNRLEKMIMAVVNFSFPDYTYPMFGDAKLTTYKNMFGNFKDWTEVYPNNDVIRYFATKGNEGSLPKYLSHELTSGGFYTFRSGWDSTSIVMVLKASPPAFWHTQPDNGNFVLWINGRRFTPDTGSYVYGGNKEVLKLRRWYRQSRNHQTLTLNNNNIWINDAHLIKWSTSDSLDVLVYSNPSYKNLTHRRTVLFINNSFFVIVDEAIGHATGELELHYLLGPGKAVINRNKNKIYTSYSDNNNLLVQCFSKEPLKLTKKVGKVSWHYRESEPRPAFSFAKMKNNEKTQRFITILYPYNTPNPPNVTARFSSNNNLSDGHLNLHITINGEPYNIAVNFNK